MICFQATKSCLTGVCLFYKNVSNCAAQKNGDVGFIPFPFSVAGALMKQHRISANWLAVCMQMCTELINVQVVPMKTLLSVPHHPEFLFVLPFGAGFGAAMGLATVLGFGLRLGSGT